MTDTVLIVDFGSQVTQLIARRVREAGVYSEIVPFNQAEAAMVRLQPKAIVLSGGPASVTTEGSPRAPQSVFDSGLPVLSICYGQQTTAVQLGGVVEGGHAAEFGRAEVDIKEASALFDGVWQVGNRYPVWMSHGDRVTRLPDGFTVKATSENAPFAVASDEKRRIYTTMFHPEVVHTPDGAKLLSNFVHKIAGLKNDWTMAHFRTAEVAKIRAQVGKARVISGLSGGVDSAVASVLIHEAIGDQLTCIFVDHGLLRHRRGRGGRAPVPGSLQHSAHSRRRARALPCRAGWQVRTPRPSARPSARCSSTCFERRPTNSVAPTSSLKARSIPT